jgi:hypothetical protein
MGVDYTVQAYTCIYLNMACNMFLDEVICVTLVHLGLTTCIYPLLRIYLIHWFVVVQMCPRMHAVVRAILAYSFNHYKV